MPYMHLDLPLAVDAGDRARIAGRPAHLYAEVMETSPRRPTVDFREPGEARSRVATGLALAPTRVLG